MGGPQPGPSLFWCHSSQLKEPGFSKGEQKLYPLIHDWGAESSHCEDPFSPGEETFKGSEVVVLPELGERSGDFQKQPEPARSFGPHCAKAKCKYQLGAGIPGWQGGRGNLWTFGSPVRGCHPRDRAAPSSGQLTVATWGLSGSGWFSVCCCGGLCLTFCKARGAVAQTLPDYGVGKKEGTKFSLCAGAGLFLVTEDRFPNASLRLPAPRGAVQGTHGQFTTADLP